MKNVNNKQKNSYNKHSRKSEFVQLYHDFHSTVYGENIWLDVDQLDFDEKILDNEDIENYLLNMIIDKGTVNFVCSPTNSGKTYGINEVFKKLNKIEKNYTEEEAIDMMKYQDDPESVARIFLENSKKYINVLMMPSNPQTVQVSRVYGMECLVGNQEENIDFDISKNSNIASVYDKAPALIELLKDKNVVMNLVIDEAHELTCSTYRANAISAIETLKEKVLENGGTVTYLTASYTPMVYIKTLDHVLFCNKRTENIDFDELVLMINNTTQSIETIGFDYLKDKKGLVRLNKKDGQRDLSTELNNIGVKSYYINSDEKECVEDKTTKERNYKNKMFNDIINNEVLPADLKLGFCTSILDAGSNISGIGDKTNKPYEFETVYICRDINDLNLMSCEQFSNRVRFLHNKNVLIMNGTEEDEEKNKDITLKYYFRKYKHLLDAQVKYFNGAILLLKECYGDLDELSELYTMEEYIKENIEGQLNLSNCFDKLKNSVGGSIRYENGEIIVDYKFFLNYCLSMYYRSLYKNTDKLKKELKKIFNKEVKVIEINDEVDSKIEKTDLEDIKKNLLEQIKNNSPIFPYFYQTEFYKEAQVLYEFSNYDINKCIELVLTLSEKELQNLYNQFSKISMTKLTNKGLKELNDILDNKKQVKDIKDEEIRENISKIVYNKQFIDKLEDGKRQGITTDEFINHYCKNDDDKEYSEFLKLKPIVKNNRFFIDGYKEMLNDYASYEQKIILEFFSNVKNTRIREKNLGKNMDNLDKLIEKLEKTTGKKKKYTRRTVLNYIKRIYTFREETEVVKGKKNKCIYLNSIRTKV